METDFEARIAQLLVRAARHGKVVPYGVFHAIFPADLSLTRRYAALERTAASICDLQRADYASLLCTDSGLPGPDFYVRFRRLHAERYYAVLGVDRSRKLRLVEKRCLAREAREQVYRHARALKEELCVDAQGAVETGAAAHASTCPVFAGAGYPL